MTCPDNSSTASSVVMALIKFYEKTKSKSVELSGGNTDCARDRVSNMNHIPNTNPPELKINCDKIVSGGTNAVKFGVASSNLAVNYQGLKIENFHHNAQDGDWLSGNKKKTNLLKRDFSIKNNSMDEFLLLVRKTKQKYKDLLEKDNDKNKKAEQKNYHKPLQQIIDLGGTISPQKDGGSIYHLQVFLHVNQKQLNY